jgi:uncharacterized membrane protein YqaE (UPF0057 family)
MASTEGTRDFGRLLISWFVPPVGVFLQVGMKMDFWINLIATFFFYVPGLVHAVWVITKYGPNGQEAADHQKDFVRLVLAALLPPAGVFLQTGFGVPFLLNAVLTCFFWFPGMIHAAWVITQKD